VRRLFVLAVISLVVGACFFPDLAGLTDGSAPSDACTSCDALSESDAGYCASLGGSHTLCEDFDNGLFSAQFSNVYASKDAAIGSDGVEFKSPPLSLFADVPVATLADDAFMIRTFSGIRSTSASTRGRPASRRCSRR